MSVKISALPAAVAAAGADQHPINQAGTTKRLTNAQIGTLMETILTKLLLAGGLISLNADGTASFGGGAVQVNAGGVLVVDVGGIDSQGTIATAGGFTSNGQGGVTGAFIILVGGIPKTFSFDGGILISVV